MSPHRSAGISRRGSRAVVTAAVLGLSSMAIAPAVAQADTPTVSADDYLKSSDDIRGNDGEYPRLSSEFEQLGEVDGINGVRATSIAPKDEPSDSSRTKNRESDPFVVYGPSQEYWQKDRNFIIDVHSESMGRDIPIQIMLPKDEDQAANSPVLYLLNGAGGGEDSANWSARTDMQQFFQDENTYVVTPLEGRFSYYTDWDNPVDDLHGENKWTTFLNEELPPVIDAAFENNHQRGLAGLSMSGSSVLSLAEHAANEDGTNPYDAVGAYSGCAATSTFPGQQYVEVVNGMRGGVNVEDMWGPIGSERWHENDAAENAEKLSGVPYVYVANGSGLPGEHDTLENPELEGNVMALGNQVVVGGLIETATNLCTHDLADRTNAMGMDNIEYNFKPTGTHSWGYWQDDLHISWPRMAEEMNVPSAEG